MPFFCFVRDIEPGEPVHLYTAKAGDVHIEIRAGQIGDDNMSVGYSFTVGGPDMKTEGGLRCFDSQWKSRCVEGDEIWIQVYKTAFTLATPISVMIRTVQANEPKPQNELAMGAQAASRARAARQTTATRRPVTAPAKAESV